MHILIIETSSAEASTENHFNQELAEIKTVLSSLDTTDYFKFEIKPIDEGYSPATTV
jgi:hypothetical protein